MTAPLPTSVQQQLQSMAAAMADLTHQNQELTREVNKHKQRHQWQTEGLGQNSKNGGAKNGAEGEDQSRGTIIRRVPHFEKEMDQMKKAMEEIRDSMRIGMAIFLRPSLLRPARVFPAPQRWWGGDGVRF